MRLSSRRVDDADLIRARLRALLDEGRSSGGWLPGDLPAGDLAVRDDGLVSTADVAAPPVADAQATSDHGLDQDHDEPRPDGGLPGGIGRHRAPGPAVRVVPARPSVRALLVTALLGAVLLVGLTWLDRPRAEPVVDRIEMEGAVEGTVTAGSAAADTAGPAAGPARATPSMGTAADAAPTVTVSVVGQVARPGLVVLPQGARVADAVAAAGGLLPGTDPAATNLAAVVTDGQQIAVGLPGSLPAPPGPAGLAGASGRVLLNSATAAELDGLPGIGPVLAQRIVDHRAENGPFTAVEQLDDVPGIGPATFDELADLVSV